MTYRKILEWPNQKLFKTSVKIGEIDDSVKSLAKDLIDTCNVSNGVGLAASQIGVNKRMFVIKPSAFGVENSDPCETNPEYMVLINPDLACPEGGDKMTWSEACLSVPFVEGKVPRSTEALVRYTSMDGEAKTLVAEWPFSAGLQHEFDHLDGILYISHLKKVARHLVLKKVAKLQKKRKRELKRNRIVIN